MQHCFNRPSASMRPSRPPTAVGPVPQASRAGIGQEIDAPSIHQPSINHPSTIHQPSINHPSNHPSTIHQPSINHPSTIHQPSNRPYRITAVRTIRGIRQTENAVMRPFRPASSSDAGIPGPLRSGFPADGPARPFPATFSHEGAPTASCRPTCLYGPLRPLRGPVRSPPSVHALPAPSRPCA